MMGLGFGASKKSMDLGFSGFNRIMSLGLKACKKSMDLGFRASKKTGAPSFFQGYIEVYANVMQGLRSPKLRGPFKAYVVVWGRYIHIHMGIRDTLCKAWGFSKISRPFLLGGPGERLYNVFRIVLWTTHFRKPPDDDLSFGRVGFL